MVKKKLVMIRELFTKHIGLMGKNDGSNCGTDVYSDLYPVSASKCFICFKL